ncbi:MAG: class I SAM-dependent methyltransferase [Xanthobacteraceae bacterium]
MAPRFIARQLSNPAGAFARVIGALMNWHNAKMNAFVLEKLAVRSSDRVLEVGFGGGLTIRPLLASAAFVTGLDRSHAAVALANVRFADAIREGRAEFREGNVEALPYGVGTFNKVCTTNTVYFWPSLERGFREIHRVISPGGRLVVGFLPKEFMDRMNMPTDIFTTRTPEDVTSAMKKAGFANVRIERPDPATPWAAAIGGREGSA